jgi:hypothetical protein
VQTSDVLSTETPLRTMGEINVSVMHNPETKNFVAFK